MILISLLSKEGIKYKQNVDTAKISSIKAGGYAKIGLYPNDTHQIIKAIAICKSIGVKYKIIGGCTNTYFSDNGYDGAVIFTSYLNSCRMEDGYIAADCGCSLSRMLKFAASHEFGIAGQLFGIPGSLGGALRNNAGAYGKEISDVFLDGMFLDQQNLKILHFGNKDLHFSYRYSDLQKNGLIFLGGRFKTCKLSKEKCAAEFSEYARKRRETQPSAPSLGSFFKRRESIIPAKLIDDANLKGHSIGGAGISPIHAGFIVNIGNATADDINNLAVYVENVIKSKFGEMLLREAEFVD